MAGVVGALLAGGKSRRMGSDKAHLEIAGQPLWRRQLETLANAGVDRVVISARDDQEDSFALEGVEIVPDQWDDAGPLGAVASCLASADGSRVLALGVDMPSMTPEMLSRLTECKSGAVFRSGDHYEPLAAVYPFFALEKATALLEAGQLAMQAFVQFLVDAGKMEVLEIAGDEMVHFENVNSPEDLPPSVDFAAGLTVVRIGEGAREFEDKVAREEPLEVRVEGRPVAVTMRTPGHDEELAMGFLFSEGVVNRAADVFEISVCPSSAENEDSRGNVVDVVLANPGAVDFEKLTRHVFTASSCGICGKASIESALGQWKKMDSDFKVSAEAILGAPGELRGVQSTFDSTGGLHGCAVFDRSGDLLLAREDIGRHNALDKLVGSWLRDGTPDLRECFLLLSGRISFELMQKAHAAGIPVVAGISAPSSLAVEFAEESGQALAAFVREGRMNVYANRWRIES